MASEYGLGAANQDRADWAKVVDTVNRDLRTKGAVTQEQKMNNRFATRAEAEEFAAERRQETGRKVFVIRDRNGFWNVKVTK